MAVDTTTPSARKIELLEAAYRYVLAHGLSDLSLRPLAAAIGTSPRVLLFLFGSKDGLVRALLARARADELVLLARLRDGADTCDVGLATAVEKVWNWLVAVEHRPLLTLWTEAYARSLVEPDGAWAGFARETVEDWLLVLAKSQPAQEKNNDADAAARTLALATLRGALLDVLATGDTERVTAAVHLHVEQLRGS